MALLAASTLATTHTAHPSLGRKETHPKSVSWRLSPRRGYTLSLRSRATRISSEFNGENTKPAKQVVTRDGFPTRFIFGAGTSSYQIEGAWDEDGKGPSIWDHYCHTYPEKIKFGHNGDVAVDSYHKYKDDVKMLKAMGMDAYRFSICWPRLLPDGTLPGGVNQKGIKYYNNLIDELIANGITPYVTLFHWETPQALDEEYRSFLDRRFVNDFKDYAELCFSNFGDRVKHWFTFNEPYVFCCNAYGSGKHAPGRCSPGKGCAVPTGDSLAEPYIAGHNLLLAHAEAARLYKQKYQPRQKGEVGIALVSMGYEPYDKNKHVDLQAQERSIDHNLGWFLEPLYRGEYPFSMRSLIKDRLPHFTAEEKAKLIGSYDMLGLNYYTSRFSVHIDLSPCFSPSVNTDDTYAGVGTIGHDGKDIGEHTGLDWLYSHPEGLRHLLAVIRERYGNPALYITENGVGDLDVGDLPKEKALEDDIRLKYLQEHIAIVKEAIESGSQVRGHFTWSLLDNLEWQNGFTHRFGLIYVDRDNNFERSMKKSAKWFAEFNAKKQTEPEAKLSGVDKKDAVGISNDALNLVAATAA